jgi:hypothetical protein
LRRQWPPTVCVFFVFLISGSGDGLAFPGCLRTACIWTVKLEPTRKPKRTVHFLIRSPRLGTNSRHKQPHGTSSLTTPATWTPWKHFTLTAALPSAVTYSHTSSPTVALMNCSMLHPASRSRPLAIRRLRLHDPRYYNRPRRLRLSALRPSATRSCGVGGTTACCNINVVRRHLRRHRRRRRRRRAPSATVGERPGVEIVFANVRLFCRTVIAITMKASDEGWTPDPMTSRASCSRRFTIAAQSTVLCP